MGDEVGFSGWCLEVCSSAGVRMVIILGLIPEEGALFLKEVSGSQTITGAMDTTTKATRITAAHPMMNKNPIPNRNRQERNIFSQIVLSFSKLVLVPLL